MTVDGRRRHYGIFYGIDPMPDPEQPLLLVWGNCQAESLRVLLAGSPSLQAATVRVPPVFELTADDIGQLRALMARVTILVSQPVRDGYRDLPLGTAEVASSMPAGSTLIRWPVLRYAGLHPYQAIIRDPRDAAHDPPVVPYHDLRTLAAVRSGQDRWSDGLEAGDGVLPAAFAAVAGESVAELRRREQQQCDIGISDALEHPQPGDMFTINHPGNRILVELAHRIQRALGRPADAADPGRDLLGGVRAPVPAAAAAALGLPVPARTQWLVGDREIPAGDVHRAQLQWYRENPVIVDAGFTRHQHTLSQLGLV